MRRSLGLIAFLLLGSSLAKADFMLWIERPKGRSNIYDKQSPLNQALQGGGGASGTATPTFTRTPSATVTSTSTTVIFSSTPTRTASPTATITITAFSPTPTLTQTPPATATASPTLSPSFTVTDTVTIGNSPTYTVTPSASATLTASPTISTTATNTLAASATNSPTVSATLTPSATQTLGDSPTVTPTPPNCPSTYNFESGLSGWNHQTSGDLAFTGSTVASAPSGACGLAAALTADFRTSPASNMGGQFILSGPMDLSCRQVTAQVYVPAGASDATFPMGAYFFAFTSAGWSWQQGTWANLPAAGGWTTITWNLSGVPDADTTQLLGIKVSIPASSPNWAGTIYIDEIDVQALTCASPTPTFTQAIGTATNTPTMTATYTPTASCPLQAFTGNTRDWYTGSDATFDLAPNGVGGAWDANITSSSANPRNPGNSLVIHLPWTGYAGAEGYNWAGWYEPNGAQPWARKVDTTQYDALEFWVRGAVGGETGLAVRLLESTGSNTSAVVDVNAVLGGPLTTTYQKVTIPLCQLSFATGDPTQVWEIDFLASGVSVDTGSMDFYVDDGRFIKTQASLASPTPTRTPTVSCSLPSGPVANEDAWWSAMPPAAQVWSSAGTSFTMDNVNPHTPGNNYMVWTAAVTGYWAGGSINWAGWSAPLFDVSQYDTFEFWIRGATGAEPNDISLGFTGMNSGAAAQISIKPYLQAGATMSTTYQLVRIPLCAFNFTGDSTQIMQMDLAFSGVDTATEVYYVDDGFFRKY